MIPDSLPARCSQLAVKVVVRVTHLITRSYQANILPVIAAQVRLPMLVQASLADKLGLVVTQTIVMYAPARAADPPAVPPAVPLVDHLRAQVHDRLFQRI
ncbi:unnamed protein product [Rotaria socialis]|uniref:Uncharacterized protein n=1 Tax=Rotaria socialis TaxID=392032 RepID=A0A817YZW8_9BILA|nr:unnamed protein product [Rotaria socialis]CAF3632056.1 unnamed protein product [Rotaria socialis]CAF3648533.1 unnamed protein product [Rotaria socialis]CAF3652360.1 unnamed protein product [Rotaria socialis]CAF4308901.1 unnamed protein product [Rotaria socialis]